MQKFQSPSSPRGSPGKKRSASQDLDDGSHEQGRPSASSAFGTSSVQGATSTGSTTTKRPPPDEDPDEERPHAFRCTDELSVCPATDTPIMKLAKDIIKQADVVGSRSVMSHPGPVIPEQEITASDRRWNDVGSGVFAKTFSGVD